MDCEIEGCGKKATFSMKEGFVSAEVCEKHAADSYTFALKHPRHLPIIHIGEKRD